MEARQALQDLRAYYAAMPPAPAPEQLLPAFDEDRLRQKFSAQERDRELERLADTNAALQNRVRGRSCATKCALLTSAQLQLQEVRYHALEDIVAVQVRCSCAALAELASDSGPLVRTRRCSGCARRTTRARTTSRSGPWPHSAPRMADGGVQVAREGV
jgi:hypothetical protein